MIPPDIFTWLEIFCITSIYEFILLKMPQLATSVSTTNAEIGKSIIVENIKEYKKKKRSKNRKACEKRQDTGPEERESSTQENMLWTENRRNFPLSGLNLYHREESKYEPHPSEVSCLIDLN